MTSHISLVFGVFFNREFFRHTAPFPPRHQFPFQHGKHPLDPAHALFGIDQVASATALPTYSPRTAEPACFCLAGQRSVRPRVR